MHWCCATLNLNIVFLDWCNGNVRSLYRADSLTAAARELARYKLDVVGVQEVRWDKGAQYEQGTIISSTEMEMKIISWEQDFLYTKGRWIFRKWEGVVGTGWIWLRIGTGGGRL